MLFKVTWVLSTLVLGIKIFKVKKVGKLSFAINKSIQKLPKWNCIMWYSQTDSCS